MWLLVGAIVSASLLGSMHCIGMCGPLALWASGSSEPNPPIRIARASLLYHLGRLLTYVLVGVLAGGLGSLLDLGASALGWQLVAAKVAGTLMILVGALQIWNYLATKNWVKARGKAKPLTPNLVTRYLIQLRPHIFRLPLELRGVLTGLLTTFLPCGWLYLFALVAAGTADTVLGGVVMAAFWVGTVPYLIALVVGVQQASTYFRRAIPVLAATLLILAGGFTFSGRGFANLHSLDQLSKDIPGLGKYAVGEKDSESVDAATLIHNMNRAVSEAKLPCCSHSSTADEMEDHPNPAANPPSAASESET